MPLSSPPLSSLYGFSLWERLQEDPGRIVVRDAQGAYPCGDLCERANWVGIALGKAGIGPGDRVLFCVPPGGDCVAALLGIWRAGALAIPLATSHPPAEWTYFAEDAKAALVLCGGAMHAPVRAWAKSQGVLCISLSALTKDAPFATPDRAKCQTALDRDAMILYTSGTTSKPKGVVISHRQLECQMEVLTKAWGWRREDVTLHVLPLHHVHGIVNILLCALWVRARCDFLERFEAQEVWRRFCTREITVFMAVPTVYRKLMDAFFALPEKEQAEAKQATADFRLMVSGSSALPLDLFDKWRKATGQTLLERYGMTEIGMALSNPYEGPRQAGTVGTPLPGVEVRLVADGEEVLLGVPHADGAATGEIQVRGPSVFGRYWQREEATRDAFAEGGWFRTGDIARRENGVYRILGRSSIDIIKTGGYKVSALEIEAVFLMHEKVHACAVIGIPHEVWGEAVILVLEGEEKDLPSFEELIAFGRKHLAPYKMPKSCEIIQTLPRNTMGKLQKKKLVDLISSKAQKEP